jgi:hypothetical protein
MPCCKTTLEIGNRVNHSSIKPTSGFFSSTSLLVVVLLRLLDRHASLSTHVFLLLCDPCRIGLRQWLIFHASIFQHIGPLSTCSSMTVLKMLPEVIGAEELFRVVALPKFMRLHQMLNSCFSITFQGCFGIHTLLTCGCPSKLFAAVPASIRLSGASW